MVAGRGAAVALCLSLAGCSGPLSSLDPAGPAAGSIATLWWVMFAGSLLLFGLVMVLLVLAFVVPEGGRRTSPKLWLVGGGLMLPAVVLTPLMVYALWGGERLFAATSADEIQVAVTGRQWEWQFVHRTGDGRLVRSLNMLHVPAGTPVRLHVTSDDVIHSFWVPRLAGKIDAIPGHTNTLRIRADKAGTYQGVCAEFCGRDHAVMQMVVMAHESPALFDRAIDTLPAHTAQ